MWKLLFFLYHWLKRQTPLAKIAYFVLALHTFFILSILLAPLAIQKKIATQKLLVRTIQPKAKMVAKTAEKKKPSPTSSNPKKQTSAPLSQSPSPKKETPPPAPSKNTTKKPEKKEAQKQPPAKQKTKLAPTPKNTAQPKKTPTISKQLLLELEESIAKIDPKRDTLRSERPSPFSPSASLPKVEFNKVEHTTQTSFEEEDSLDDYADVLVHYLHHHLKLPEYGVVKIQLILQKDGFVKKLIVLQSESERNKKHLEQELPKMRFPDFGILLSGKKEQTFVLTFSNEI